MCSALTKLSLLYLSLEAWAELGGAISGILLLMSAWRANEILHDVHEVQRIAQKREEQDLGRVADNAAKRNRSIPAQWQRVDHWCLRGGLALFIVASLIKCALAVCK